ncbi:MAG: hypothetical protein KatS3mg131_3121 [Candidatus Tectimicrobiota bacterium]|nr:MAG: hypothetical protein KatS3mg131_3121 [Candidatus Tectomicrobia bacterium]
MLSGCLLLAAGLPAAEALESLRLQAVMTPREAIRYDFPAPPQHFVLLVRRTGTVEGSGIWQGAQAVEYGMHDIRPGDEGVARGYLVLTLASGDQAFIQWQVQATFVPGPEGKPKLLDNGVWRFVGGTGSLSGIKGAGILHIKPVSKTDRRFLFEGHYVLP